MAGVAGKSGRKSGFPEALADTCVEIGLNKLVEILLDSSVSREDKWKAVQPLVLKRAPACLEVSGIDPVVRQITLIHNYNKEDNSRIKDVNSELPSLQ